MPEGKFERLPELAEELVRLKVEILVVPSATAAQAAKKSNVTIPIVMMRAGDPFSRGLVASLARPGGNVTGLYQYSPELLGKRLELLKEVVPKVSRFAFLNSTGASAAKSMFEETQVAAKALGVKFQYRRSKNPKSRYRGRVQSYRQRNASALSSQKQPPSSVLTEKRFWS